MVTLNIKLFLVQLILRHHDKCDQLLESYCGFRSAYIDHIDKITKTDTRKIICCTNPTVINIYSYLLLSSFFNYNQFQYKFDCFTLIQIRWSFQSSLLFYSYHLLTVFLLLTKYSETWIYIHSYLYNTDKLIHLLLWSRKTNNYSRDYQI